MELDLMKKMGLNTVALIFPDKGDSEPPAFVDFMERAQMHGLKCHVYIEGLAPCRPDPKKALRLIRAARLGERPAMFAYDAGWETRIGRENKRKELNDEW